MKMKDTGDFFYRKFNSKTANINVKNKSFHHSCKAHT